MWPAGRLRRRGSPMRPCCNSAAVVGRLRFLTGLGFPRPHITLHVKARPVGKRRHAGQAAHVHQDPAAVVGAAGHTVLPN
jgi:hypothetical protein